MELAVIVISLCVRLFSGLVSYEILCKNNLINTNVAHLNQKTELNQSSNNIEFIADVSQEHKSVKKSGIFIILYLSIYMCIHTFKDLK